MKTVPLTVLLALAWLSPALADPPAIEAGSAWARATPGAARAGAAYLTLTNRGSAPHRVVAAETAAAARAELHTHRMDGAIMRMRKLDGIDLAPGATVTLKPGGHHVMLMGLRAPLKPGERFPLTLTLANGEKITVTVAVKKIGAMGPGMSHGGGMRHGQ